MKDIERLGRIEWNSATTTHTAIADLDPVAGAPRAPTHDHKTEIQFIDHVRPTCPSKLRRRSGKKARN